jgi:hypothetical protein
MNLYLILCTVIFFALGIAWKKSDVPNFLIKIILLAMGLVSFVLTLESYGFILKTH